MANNDNFAQDVTDNQLNGNAENGGGDSQQDNNSAEAPGRDDDRYSWFYFCALSFMSRAYCFVYVFRFENRNINVRCGLLAACNYIFSQYNLCPPQWRRSGIIIIGFKSIYIIVIFSKLYLFTLAVSSSRVKPSRTCYSFSLKQLSGHFG